MLYNQQLKEEYFNDVSDMSKKMLIKRFESFGDNIESIYGKDLNELTKEEFRIGLSNMNYKSYTTLRNEISQISKYIDWCILNLKIFNTSNPLINFNAYSVNIDKTVKLYYIKDEDTLLNIIHSSDCDIFEVEPSIACLKWLGLSNDQIINLEILDVDFLNNTVLGLSVTDKIMEVLKSHFETKCYKRSKVIYSKHYRDNKFLCRFHCENWNKEKKVNDDLISNGIRKLIKTSKYANANNILTSSVYILESGKLFNLHLREVLNRDLTKEDFGDICKIKNEDGSIDANKLKDYMELYNSYNRVFWR